jgi:hypothetical protein
MEGKACSRALIGMIHETASRTAERPRPHLAAASIAGFSTDPADHPRNVTFDAAIQAAAFILI